MPSLFISDLHLTPDRPDTTRLFLEFIDDHAASAEALYILGDLFEYWIGDDAADMAGARPVLEALAGLSRSGVPISFVSGNRDFLVGEGFAQETGISLLPDGTVIDLYGCPVLLMHGDSLCTDDIEHQAFRGLVLDPAWQEEFLALPIPERIRMAEQARMTSKQTTSEKPMEIMDVNANAVIETLQAHKVTMLIHGHTHRPAIHPVQLVDSNATRVVLGDWYEQTSMCVAEPGQLSLLAHGEWQDCPLGDSTPAS